MNLEDVVARVRALAEQGKLDKHLHPQPDGGLPWSAWLWVNGAMAVVALGFHLAAMAQRAQPGDDHPPVPDLLHALALLALVGLCFLGARLFVAPADRRRQRLLKQGVVVPGAIVQANDRWFADDNEEPQPGSVVLSFDGAALAEPGLLREVARALADLKAQDRRALPPATGEIAWNLYHELGPTAPLPVPAELARGLRNTWLVSAMIPAQPIRHGDGQLLLLARSGETAAEFHSVLGESLFDG